MRKTQAGTPELAEHTDDAADVAPRNCPDEPLLSERAASVGRKDGLFDAERSLLHTERSTPLGEQAVQFVPHKDVPLQQPRPVDRERYKRLASRVVAGTLAQVAPLSDTAPEVAEQAKKAWVGLN